jgi:GTPase SAR1 family protein
LFIQANNNQNLQLNMKGGLVKKILIVGPPRCGKTTLVQMITDKYPIEIIRGDSLGVAVEQALIDDRLKESLKTDSNVLYYPSLDDDQLLSLFQTTFNQIEIDIRGQDKPVVLDASIWSLELIEKYLGSDSYIYCLGMPELTPIQFANALRLHDTKFDWTSRVGNTSLLKFGTIIIETSKALREDSKKFPNVKFFDTSENRTEILKEIFQDIEKIIV